MFDLAEVFFAQTKQRRAEKLRVAADIVVRMRMQLVAVSVVPLFFGLVSALEVHGARIPVVLFARHVTAALEDQYFLSRRRQLVGERAAAGAAADNDDVVMIAFRHAILSEVIAGPALTLVSRGL